MTYDLRRPFLSLISGMDRFAVGMSQRLCPTPSVPRIEERIPGIVFVMRPERTLDRTPQFCANRLWRR